MSRTSEALLNSQEFSDNQIDSDYWHQLEAERLARQMEAEHKEGQDIDLYFQNVINNQNQVT